MYCPGTYNTNKQLNFGNVLIDILCAFKISTAIKISYFLLYRINLLAPSRQSFNKNIVQS
jgi:hypothetical protein